MKLRDYLRENQITDASFAAKVGVSPFAVRKWKYGERMPRRAHLRLIRAATAGAVLANDFMADAGGVVA